MKIEIRNRYILIWLSLLTLIVLTIGGYYFIEKYKDVDKMVGNTNFNSDIGIRDSLYGLYEPVVGIRPQKIMKLDDVTDSISNKKIIYIGEIHGNYEEHNVQLEIIKGLYYKSDNKSHKLVIGMEMFQRPFQRDIDDYISGNITEKEFLKYTEYFKRWGYDYNLYREIISFAKVNNIPIIAINQKSEIITGVSNEGLDVLDTLTDNEKKDISTYMNISNISELKLLETLYDGSYRDRLKETFEQHKVELKILGRKFELANFDYFYQSQILSDETMAHSIDEFMKRNPDSQMVVLAGVGHLMYGSGIPKRVYKLNDKDYDIIIQASKNSPINEYMNKDTSKDIGDFVLFPKPAYLPIAPKLGVIIGYMNGRVSIDNVEIGSIADKQGIKKDDILISIDGNNIETIEDVRISMFDKRRGDIIKIKVLRDSFKSSSALNSSSNKEYKEFNFTIAL